VLKEISGRQVYFNYPDLRFSRNTKGCHSVVDNPLIALSHDHGRGIGVSRVTKPRRRASLTPADVTERTNG